MKLESLSFFISLISLTLSIFYFLSFYSFKNSNIISFDHEKLYLNRDNSFVCDDIHDKKSCKRIIYDGKMINFGRKDNDNNIYLNKNIMICDNVYDLKTCTCLSNKCDFQNKLNHITFIDKPMSFSDSRYGMQYGGRVIPIENRNNFTFATWININIIDLEKWRSILVWRRSEFNVNPAILISPSNWSTCKNLIDVRFNSLYKDNKFNKELNGTFNVVGNEHGHCMRDTIYNYFKWFHLAIVGKEDTLQFFINGNLVQEEKLLYKLEIGSEDDKLYIGGSPEYSAEGIILSKTRWYAKPLNSDEISILVNEHYD